MASVTDSQAIWKRPETMFKEVFAHQLLTDFLEKHGFTVAEHYKVDPTAFRAEFQSANYKMGVHPTIGVMCEYDTLPEIGHAYGIEFRFSPNTALFIRFISFDRT